MIKEQAKTKPRLIEEISVLKLRIQQLEQSESARKKAEEALRESEEKYRLLIENSHDIIYMLTPDGVFTFVSPGWTTLLGHPVSQVVGKPFQQFVHPDDIGRCEIFLHRVIRTGQRQTGVEYRVRHANGNWRWHNSNAVPLRAGSGAVVGFEGIASDITENKRAEEALKQSEELFRAIFDSTSDPIVVWDRNYNYIYANQAAIDHVGASSDKVIGGNIQDGLGHIPDFMQLWMSRIDHVFETKKVMRVEDAMPVGENFEYSESVISPISDGQGNILAVGVIYRNITDHKQAQEELREIQRQQKALLNNIPDMAWLKDKESRFIAVNEAFGRSCGYKPENLIGKTDLDIWPKELAERYKADDREVMESGKRKQVEEPLIDSEGKALWIETIKTPIYDDKGDVTGSAGISRDITVRKRAEESTKESQQQLADIINFLPDATLVIDKEGKVLAWNRAMEEMTGVIEADVLGKGNYEYALPFYGERRPMLVDLVLKPQEDIEAKYVRTDRRDLTLEGEAYMPALRGGEVYLFGTASALRDSKGNIIGAIESIRDITARRHTEEALIKAEEKFRGIFENAVMGIFHSTPGGRIISANFAFARILGYESPEEILNTVTDMARQLFVHPERRAKLLQDMNENGMIQEQEIQFFRKDGSIASLVVNGRAVRNSVGKLLYYEGAIQDITDQKLLESQLRQAYKMEAIGTLAGGIAHDFNNILSAVIGYAEMAQREQNGNDRLRRYHDQIYNAGKRARDLVKQILAFSRQSGEKKQPLRVSPVIKEVLKLLRASLPSTIQIHQDIQSEPDTVLADPTQIHQIVMNLCTNAAQAMRKRKGELKVSLVPVEIKPQDTLNSPHGLNPGMYLNLTVSDTGNGIEPAIMARIFDPFFTTKKPGEGTGMGLSVVHGIVKSYHGAITVESEAGKGTAFHVYLPLLKETGEKRDVEAAADIAGGKERILFVDDDEVLVQLGKDMLSGMGYEVIERTSSQEALKLFRSQPGRFDLVITDMTMPYMTGIELAREIMRIRPGIPVILCTGFSEEITPEKAKSLGLKEFIMKPIVISQIAAAIRRVIDQKE